MYKTKENKKGVSLIVLVITIIVIIILAAAIILTLTGNNPILQARKATFLNDVATFKDELNMYKTNEYAKRMGEYDPTLLDATSSGLTYNGASVSGQNNIYYIIKSLEGKQKYLNEFEIEDGELKYTGTNPEKGDWAQNDAGIVSEAAKPTVEMSTSNVLPVKAGTSVIYNVTMNASVEITTTNLSGNIKILNNSGVEIGTQPIINVGSVTGTTTEKTATITINTTGMAEGIYKIKILGEAVKTASQGNIESIATQTFEIDNTAPNMPTINATPTTATSGNVTVTITKASASDTLEYSTNGTTWITYTTDLTVTSNLTVYARETDSANNVSSQATQIINNIDKTAPQNATMSLTTTADKINGTITIVDSGSGINVSQSKYLVTTQSTIYGVSDVAWNSATVMGVTSKTISETKADGTYYVQVLSTDNAGNKVVNISSAIIVKSFPVIGNALSTYTWSEIKQISESGKADDYFNVGDTKTFTTTVTGHTITMQIIGFNHDTKSNGTGLAGITFCTKYSVGINKQMNPIALANGGWRDSAMRVYTNGELLNQFPSDLKTSIVPVYKTANTGGWGVNSMATTSDSVFLLSEVEVFDFRYYTEAGEGTLYKFFEIPQNRIIYPYAGAPIMSFWWLRSPDTRDYGRSDLFLRHYSDYYQCTGGVSASATDVVLVFCFCI